tara:strand:+ start:6640 stop:8037 length:1398 start_codon:yes stop_codon:yes gene_type:complete
MAEGNTPRFGAYDPEADLIDAYGELPIVPTFVDPTVFGLSNRNPGFAIAADNPGVPVILPTTVPTNPGRELKGVRYDGGGYGDFVPTFENRNPMAPNVPEGVSFSDERGMDPALIGAMFGGSLPFGAGTGLSAASGVPQKQKAASDAADLYRRAMAGDKVAYDPSYVNPRKFVQFSDEPYRPTSYRGEFPDKRMAKEVSRERLMMVPKESRINRDSGPNTFRHSTMRDERLAPEITKRTGNVRGPDEESFTPYQSGADFADRRMMEVRARSPFKRRVSPAYDRKLYQTGTARGAHSDPVLADLNLNRQAAINRLVNARNLQMMGEGLSGPGSISGTLAGGVAGEAYDETFGEGDTRYMDPSGEQRMAVRQAGAKIPTPSIYYNELAGQIPDSAFKDFDESMANSPAFREDFERFSREADAKKMPARAGRQIKEVLADREARLYRELGQELPAVGPLFAFDPYQGY